ncbi:MAG: hypothetical protein V2B14_02325 [bacterium]
MYPSFRNNYNYRNCNVFQNINFGNNPWNYNRGSQYNTYINPLFVYANWNCPDQYRHDNGGHKKKRTKASDFEEALAYGACIPLGKAALPFGFILNKSGVTKAVFDTVKKIGKKVKNFMNKVF